MFFAEKGAFFMPIINIGLNVRGVRQGAAEAVTSLQSVSRATDSAQKEINKFTEALKSAAKQIAAFVGLYKTLDGLKGFAMRGVEFNDTMESSQIAIGSLIASMAKLEDSQGRILEGAEKYTASQQIASEMMQKIQKLGLETTATTTELVQGVQSVMGEALKAGLKLQEIPDFSVAAAQAMETMAIPLEQMRTEIEALLSGSINPAQDLLAPRLGVNRELIESWKAQGILFEELMKKLEAFKRGGEDIARTWSGLTSNLKEALDVISGQAARGLSEELKKSVEGLQHLFIDSREGVVGISQDFQQVADVIERVQTLVGEQILSLINSFADSVRWVNKAITDMGGADAALASAKSAVITLTAALGTLSVVRNSGVQSAAKAMATEIQFANAVASGKAVILGSAEAERQKALAAVELARAENEAANAAVNSAQKQLQDARAKLQNAVSFKQLSQATLQEARAQSVLAQTQEHQRKTSEALSTAEMRLADATRIAATETARNSATAMASSAIWQRASAVMVAGATRIATAFRALWAALGGGVGVAVTALITGFTYLSTRQDAAKRSTDLLREAEELYTKATKNAADETGALTGSLNRLEKTQLEIGKRKLELSLGLQIKEITKSLDEALSASQNYALGLGHVTGTLEGLVPKELSNNLQDILSQLKDGKITAQEFGEKLSDLRDNFVAAGMGGHDLVKAIDEVLTGEEKSVSQLIDTTSKLEMYNDALKIRVQNVQEVIEKNKDYVASLELLDKAQNTEISTTEEAMKWLYKRIETTESYTKTVEENARAKDTAAMKEIELAEAYATMTLAATVATATLSENTEETTKAINAALSNLHKIQAARAQFQKGLQELYTSQSDKETKKLEKEATSTARSAEKVQSKIDDAKKSVEKLREEIDILNGSLSREGVALKNKILEIEELGKNAKMSADEIAKLKADYTEAFKTDMLKDFDKELLKLSDDVEALRAIEIAQTLNDWALKFEALGMSADEARPYIEKLNKALQEQDSYKDLQTAAEFYKELEQLSGQYGLSIEYTNKLIERQVKLWNTAGIPPEYIDKMRELKLLEADTSGWAGAKRAMLSYYADATNSGRQWEHFMTNSLSSIEDAFVNFTMTGKFSFNDLANSIINDLVRMYYKAMVLAPLMKAITGIGDSIGSGIGGFLGGSITTGGSSMTGGLGAVSFGANAAANLFSAQGNVFTGGNLSKYSDTVVRTPTMFEYGSHVSAFARGAGLMGEAGPEAIMPLRRGPDGTLGITNYTPNSTSLSAGSDVTVNVINNTSQPAQAQAQATPNQQGGLTIDVILDQLESGMVQRDLAGKSRFGNYLDSTRGLSRAGASYRWRRRVS